MRVVFIAGANHSGTTLTGCILGAGQDPHRHFHVGEVYAYFTPHHRRYGSFIDWYKRSEQSPEGRLPPDPSPGETKALRRYVPEDSAWRTIDHRVGPERAYREIAARSGAETIIDSSKNLEWLAMQAKVCQHNGWPLDVVLCIRDFAAIARSDERRVKEPKLSAANLEYYTRFVERHDGPTVCILDVDRLIARPDGVTAALCARVGIPYFEGKERYWEYRHDYRYGARTQRFQLWSRGERGFLAPTTPLGAERGDEVVPQHLLVLQERLRGAAIGGPTAS
jgi:hypothetical protein